MLCMYVKVWDTMVFKKVAREEVRIHGKSRAKFR